MASDNVWKGIELEEHAYIIPAQTSKTAEGHSTDWDALALVARHAEQTALSGRACA